MLNKISESESESDYGKHGLLFEMDLFIISILIISCKDHVNNVVMLVKINPCW